MPNRTSEANVANCKAWRQGVKSDPFRLAEQRDKGRLRQRRHRERQRALSDGMPTGFVDREPEPDHEADPWAWMAWEWLRDIRLKEIREGREIFEGTCPEALERYRTRFGLDL